MRNRIRNEKDRMSKTDREKDRNERQKNQNERQKTKIERQELKGFCLNGHSKIW